MRLPPELIGGDQRVLGAGEVTLVEPDTSELTERPADLATKVRAQFFARSERLGLGLVAATTEAQDLRAMHTTATVEAADGVGPRPPFHGLGPLLGAVILRETLKRAHKLAEEDASRQRVERAGDGSDAGLIEHRHAGRDVTVENTQTCLGDGTDGSGRRIRGRAHLDRATRPNSGALDVSDQEALIVPNHGEPRVRGRRAAVVKELLGASEPSAHGRHQGRVEQQMHRDANSRRGGHDLIAGFEELRVCPLPRLDGDVEMPRAVRRIREYRQIDGRDEALGVGLRKSLEGAAPITGRRCGVRRGERVLGIRLHVASPGARVTVCVTGVTVLLTPRIRGRQRVVAAPNRGGAMEKATVNGVELEYEVTGRGEPVLCISPVLADAFAPLATEESLAGCYQLIRYHKRGWVGSTHTEGPVSVEDHAADASALLDHLGVRHAHVVGHSSGGAVAAQLAVGDLDRVHSLTLLEPSLLSVPSGQAFLEQAAPVFETYAAGDHERAIAMFLVAVSGLDWNDCRELLDARVDGMVAQAIKDADTFFGVELPGLTQWVFGEAEAAHIRRPVLSILGGRTGPLWVEVAAFLRASLPYVEEREIDGVGHLLQVQDPRSVAWAVADFLERNPMDTANDATIQARRSAAS